MALSALNRMALSKGVVYGVNEKLAPKSGASTTYDGMPADKHHLFFVAHDAALRIANKNVFFYHKLLFLVV